LHHTIDELSVELEALEQNRALLAVDSFCARTAALDAIEVNILERSAELSGATGATSQLRGLQHRARVLRSSLEQANRHLFAALREQIRSGNYTGAELERQLRAYTGYGPDISQVAEIGYDNLDALISGLFTAPAPVETQARAPEMVFYQPTPARITLDLIARAHLSARDVFYDLGSGLGQVVILVHLLTGVRARGVEYEPAYCAYARQCAGNLGLPGAEFINGDARDVELAEGTVFYMYTPFEGEMLQAVLRRLQAVSRSQAIRLFTYGPCTSAVLGQSWLSIEDGRVPDPARLAVFHSVSP
jgi:hypothetical protein